MTARHKTIHSKGLEQLNLRLRRQGNISKIFRKSTASRKYAVRTAQAVISGKRENLQIVNAIDAVVTKMEHAELKRVNRRLSAIGDVSYSMISTASKGKYSEKKVRALLTIKGKVEINTDVLDLAIEFIKEWDRFEGRVTNAPFVPISRMKYSVQ